MSPEREMPPLDPGEMLQSEFTYISQTAFQANQDRARVTTFYLVNLAGLLAVVSGVAYFLVQMLLYWRLLAEKKSK